MLNYLKLLTFVPALSFAYLQIFAKWLKSHLKEAKKKKNWFKKKKKAPPRHTWKFKGNVDKPAVTLLATGEWSRPTGIASWLVSVSRFTRWSYSASVCPGWRAAAKESVCGRGWRAGGQNLAKYGWGEPPCAAQRPERLRDNLQQPRGETPYWRSGVNQTWR